MQQLSEKLIKVVQSAEEKLRKVSEADGANVKLRLANEPGRT